jgi:hypothetical protein
MSAGSGKAEPAEVERRENGSLAPRAEGRVGMLVAVSDWLKLLALMVLSAEAVLGLLLARCNADDPLRPWFLVSMLAFFALITVGIFFDRYVQHGSVRSGMVTRQDVATEAAAEDVDTLDVPIPGKREPMHIRLAPEIAIVSPALRNTKRSEILRLLAHKMHVHTWVFRYPSPSAIIPIDDKYFARLSWDETTIWCNEIFEIPEKTDPEYWFRWCTVQSQYVEAYSSPHRQPENDVADAETVGRFANRLRGIAEKLEEFCAQSPEQLNTATRMLLEKLKSELEGINLQDRSKSQSNAVVRLELALSTIHDILRRTMPRVVSI